MRFAIFADQLGRVAAEPDRFAEQRLDPCPTLPILRGQLSLGQAPQETAARGVLCLDLRVDARQQVIGQRDHHLCHVQGIAGIAYALPRSTTFAPWLGG